MERKGFTANACAISLVTQSLLEGKSRKLTVILRLKNALLFQQYIYS